MSKSKGKHFLFSRHSADFFFKKNRNGELRHMIFQTRSVAVDWTDDGSASASASFVDLDSVSTFALADSDFFPPAPISNEASGEGETRLPDHSAGVASGLRRPENDRSRNPHRPLRPPPLLSLPSLFSGGRISATLDARRSSTAAAEKISLLTCSGRCNRCRSTSSPSWPVECHLRYSIGWH